MRKRVLPPSGDVGWRMKPRAGSGQSLHQIERLAVLMAQSEGNESMRDHGSDQGEGGKSGSRIGAAFADRIQETLTQMRLMCKRAFEKITTIRFQITADSVPFTILQIRMTTRRSSGSGPNRCRRSRRAPQTLDGQMETYSREVRRSRKMRERVDVYPEQAMSLR